MKKNIYTILCMLGLVALTITSCKKDLIDNDHQVGSSKITYYADVTVKGNQYESVVKGTPYTDEGATATEQGKDIPVKSTGTVDVNTPGIYTITYTAINSDGYSASQTRTVAVLPEAEKPGTDLSGKYGNVGSFNYTAEVDKLAPGFYYTDNCWGGSSAAVISAYFICTNGTDIILPLQKTAYGGLQGEGTITAGGLITWKVTLLDQGPFTSTKQWQRK